MSTGTNYLHVLRGGGTAPPQKMYNLIESDVVPEELRGRYWANRNRQDYGVAFHCDTQQFHGRLQSRLMGRCSLHRATISHAHRAARADKVSDLVLVTCQIRNSGARYCGKREISLAPGSMMVYAASESYYWDFDGAAEWLVLGVRRSDLSRHIIDLDRHLEDVVNYDGAMVSLLSNTIRGLLDADMPVRQSVDDTLADSLVSLLAATLLHAEEERDRVPSYSAAATLHRARSYIAENLAEPDLNPATVADAMGITVSYLHKIFLTTQTTLMQYVMAERLERCRADIARLDRARSISQIAYNWGFNDASHFSRSFRSRFGVSPKQYREQTQERNARFGRPPAA